ncbi:pentatricopeptide repeat-containing protein At2g15980 [Amaranthus tricolor]|uniref:pentatricopeptide repeat-containing protein At2g15980 n=1 Tax=Amaranthus tricolor TaxID=29722 RepID=UPI00258F8198|nr:pentatricopeptide repeat-containing protein At2g15980 [Amaranthus tricolor]
MSISIFKRVCPRATTLLPCSSFSSSSQSPDNTAVSAAVSILTHQRSKSRWSALLSLYPHGFTPSQTSQILLKIRNNPHLSLNFFLFNTRHFSSSASLLSYATIIHILARARLKSRAKSLIKSTIKKFDFADIDESKLLSGKNCKLFRVLVETYRVCDSAPFVFDLLIKSLLEMNKLDPCIDIVRMLQSREFYLNVSTYTDLISTGLRIKGCFFGYDLYKELFTCNDKVKRKLVPKVHIFNDLMLSFHRNGFLDMVEEVWIEMIKSKCEPDSYSFSILMEAYCEEADIGKAEKVWEELKLKGLNPDIVGYNTLIGGYCRMGKVQKGEELYREMEMEGIKGSCVTYKHLIHGYCLAGDADSAMLLYNDMCRKGFESDSSIVDSLVAVHCSKKSVLEALEFFGVAMKNAGFVAKESSYELLMKGLCDEGKIDEALKLQAHMAGKGLSPNSQIYGAFIDGYIKLGNQDVVESLRKEMKET